MTRRLSRSWTKKHGVDIWGKPLGTVKKQTIITKPIRVKTQPKPIPKVNKKFEEYKKTPRYKYYKQVESDLSKYKKQHSNKLPTEKEFNKWKGRADWGTEINKIKKKEKSRIATPISDKKTTYIMEYKVKGNRGRYLPYRGDKSGSRYKEPVKFSSKQEAEKFAVEFKEKNKPRTIYNKYTNKNVIIGINWETRIKKIEYDDNDEFSRKFW